MARAPVGVGCPGGSGEMVCFAPDSFRRRLRASATRCGWSGWSPGRMMSSTRISAARPAGRGPGTEQRPRPVNGSPVAAVPDQVPHGCLPSLPALLLDRGIGWAALAVAGVPGSSHEGDGNGVLRDPGPAASWWTAGRCGGAAGLKRLGNARIGGEQLQAAFVCWVGGGAGAWRQRRITSLRTPRRRGLIGCSPRRNVSSAVAFSGPSPQGGLVATESSLVPNSAGLREELAGRRCSQPWPVGVATWQERP